jgi:hypothetical protein
MNPVTNSHMAAVAINWAVCGITVPSGVGWKVELAGNEVHRCFSKTSVSGAMSARASCKYLVWA